MGRLIDGGMDREMAGRTNGYLDRQMNKWSVGKREAQIDGLMEERMNVLKDGQISFTSASPRLETS